MLQWINGWSNSLNPFLKFFSVALNVLWVKIALGIFLIWMIASNAQRRTAALLALVAIGIGNTMTNILKSGLPMHRPFQEFRFVSLQDDGNILTYNWSDTSHFLNSPKMDLIVRVGTTDSMGTASAHSANMAALAFVMCYYMKWWGSPWVLVALLTGISRVYVGAHYPSQVLLGWLVGLFSAFVVIKTWEAFQRTRKGVQSDENEPELA